MKNKLFILFIALIACISVVHAEIIEKVQIGDLYYNLDTENNTAEVAKDAYKNLSIVTIPATIDYNTSEYSVTQIGTMAFYGCRTITSVTLSDGIISIGSGAFCYCSNLQSINLGNTLQTIETNA